MATRRPLLSSLSAAQRLAVPEILMREDQHNRVEQKEKEFCLTFKLVKSGNDLKETSLIRQLLIIMKLFRTSNTEIIAEYQHYFGFSLVSRLTVLTILKCRDSKN